MNPSHAPVGLSMKPCHWGKANNPFIKLPSYPLDEENMMSERMQKLSLRRCFCLYHGPLLGKTAASSSPTAFAFAGFSLELSLAMVISWLVARCECKSKSQHG